MQCSPEGTLVIYSRQYTGPVPGGTAAGVYAYALTFLRVEEFGDAAGPVIISQQPQSRTVLYGGQATFSVSAFASGAPVSYQWLKDGAAIPNATGSLYRILYATSPDAGVYSVVVSNTVNAVTSAPVALVVGSPAPFIVAHPVSQLFATGADYVFAVQVAGALPLHYQWQFEEVDLPGATAHELLVAGAQLENTGRYRVLVSNGYGTAISSNALLTPFTIDGALNSPNLDWTISYFDEWPIQSQVTHDGFLALQSGPLSGYNAQAIETTVEGPCTVGFWWKLSSPNQTSTYSFTVPWIEQVRLRGNAGWEYHNVYIPPGAFTLKWQVNNSGAPTSDKVTAYLDELTYIPGGRPPLVLVEPTQQSLLAGAAGTFRATAEGFSPLRYQWQCHGVDMPNANNPVFTVHNAQAAQAGTYTVIVSNDYGSASANAELNIENSAPVFLPCSTNLFALPTGETWLRARLIGSEPRSFQWQFNDTPIPGATNELLQLRNVDTNQVGHYSVVVSNTFGHATGPDIWLQLTEVHHVLHISVDGLGATQLARGLLDDPERFSNFQRLLDEGAGTLNARCDYFASITVPNHLCMLTGRPVLQPEGQPDTVAHGYTADSSSPGVTIHASGNTNVPYKASVFDVVHDHGLSTVFLAGKSSLSICADSYNAVAGAPDLIPPDNGPNKIDFAQIASSGVLVDVVVSNLVSSNFPNYSFLHFADTDYAGHSYGWGSPEWFDVLANVDTMLGNILTTLETNLPYAAQSVIVLTADHGGGAPATTHVYPTEPLNFTIPLLAWGPGFPAGEDLYSLFANREDPAPITWTITPSGSPCATATAATWRCNVSACRRFLAPA